ncbi:MAG: symmetrical bis(5'-nucleosyl)-tetraphosphatase [Burkholderiales bacterium]|nr:symmetrical bis(5'-nucleosyl)-tetraphosphatase [Burkholderiales bacterium]
MTSPTSIPRPLAIGDLQGCNARLGALLHRADPDNSRPLWFAGDLVNRGPHSLAALRRLRALGDRATVVLGNHDLHLLASATGVRKTHRSDTLGDIMLADDRPALLDWVRTRPLAHLADGHLMVHAGVFPQWTPEETVALAAEVQAVLSGPDWVDFLRVMYGNTPTRWSHSLSGDDRLRTIVNGLTRMRFIDAEGGMDFAVKEGADAAPPGLTPWFDVPGRRTANVTVIFGHWSTLGLLIRPNLLGLDTGCVWGGSLTAVSLHDREVFQVKCHRERDPSAH